MTRKEVHAATQYLLTLFSAKLATSAQESFVIDLNSRLEKRFASCWYENDAERGSALRAILWHGHGGGEGVDQDVLSACRANLPIDTDCYFSCSFTLWVDPGCVAIRKGAGPGTLLSSCGSFANNHVQVIFGTMPTTQPKEIFQTGSSPYIAAVDSNTHLSSMSPLHYRAPSQASGLSVDRVPSLGGSSVTTNSTDESEPCPSLDNASTVHDSDIESDMTSDISIEDMIDRAGFKNFDIIDHCDEEAIKFDNQASILNGDTTAIGDETICGNADDTVHQVQEPPKPTITSYDGGNVGVLGGGVRLGAGKPHTNKATERVKLMGSVDSKGLYHSSPVSYQMPPQQNINTFNTYAHTWSPSMVQTSSTFGNYSTNEHMQNNFPAQQYIIIDGYAVPLTQKRGRSRGRRSRGRGAGRAARRQAAAALRAQNFGEQLGGSDTRAVPSSIEDSTGFSMSAVTYESSDTQIMNLVRQRADQVNKSLEHRQMGRQHKKSNASLRDHYMNKHTQMHGFQSQLAYPSLNTNQRLSPYVQYTPHQFVPTTQQQQTAFP